MPALNTAPAALDDVENAAQRSWGTGNQVLNQQLLRMNEGDNYIASTSRQNFGIANQLINYVGAQAMLGSDPTLQASILAARSAGAQPQSGGGPGQPVSFPVQQQLPTPAVYSVNPTTGAITKA
jgi:hypothetical protein